MLLPWQRLSAKVQSAWRLLANGDDYVGLGRYADEPGNPHWVMRDGTTLPMSAVTHWGALSSVPFSLGAALEQKDLLDEDGYPTTYTRQLVEQWPYHDPLGWFELIQRVWCFPERFQRAETDTHIQYLISTSGWSGNEGLLASMQRNELLWDTVWRTSERGGHHVFEVEKRDLSAGTPAPAAN